MQHPRMHLTGTVLGTPDPPGLARFYGELLGFPVRQDEPGWVALRDPGGGAGLAFQAEDDYLPPTWPPRRGEQQMMMHLDLEVDELEPAVAYAVSLGAKVADFQPQQDVRVLLDPDGHPFCLWVATED
jgi:catechol 2,3-dioxygenase-like lactoylglutathione lyase family enzyme